MPEYAILVITQYSATPSVSLDQAERPVEAQSNSNGQTDHLVEAELTFSARSTSPLSLGQIGEFARRSFLDEWAEIYDAHISQHLDWHFSEVPLRLQPK